MTASMSPAPSTRSPAAHSGPRLALLLALAVLTALVFWMCLGVGTTGIDLLAPLDGQPIVLAVRLPRVILAAFVGAGLAVAGVALQAVLQNPLADPYVVGVSGGAALGGVLALALGAAGATLPLWAFAGAMGFTVFLLALARASGRDDPLTLLLVGVVFNAVVAAIVTFVKTVVSAEQAQQILFWLMGVVGVEPWERLGVLAVLVTLGSAVLLLFAGSLNLLALGDDEAATLGLSVGRSRWLAFSAAALVVAAVVSVAGLIGFVGLVVPHVLRRLVGADHRVLVPASLLAGAAFLMVADAGARAFFFAAGTEIPVGVVTAFAGGPFFLLLLLRRERRL